MLVALDPGKRVGGFALFDDHNALVFTDVVSVHKSVKDTESARFFAFAVSRLVTKFEETCSPEHLVAEWPENYGASSGAAKAKAGDLLFLAATVGAVSGLLQLETTHVAPKTWKGQLPKEVCQQRIEKRLSSDELKVWHDLHVRRGASWHHAADAVGIGLWYLKRFNR